jgi:hypothetical protein
VGESAIGKVAKVVTRVRGSTGPGEICVLVSGTYETVIAYSESVLDRGSEVLVISARSSGSYDVVPWPDTTAGAADLTPGPDADGVAGTSGR